MAQAPPPPTNQTTNQTNNQPTNQQPNILKSDMLSGVVTRVYNPSTQEAEEGRLKIEDLPVLYKASSSSVWAT